MQVRLAIPASFAYLTQGVPLDDVQYLAGHASPRTTRLYDRRQKKVTRNIVERISISVE
jgi:integrase/recombinase XerD